jgi:hypothetical protein
MRNSKSDSKSQEIINEVGKMIEDQARFFEPYRAEFYRQNNLRIYQILVNPDVYKENWSVLLYPCCLLGYLIAKQELGVATPLLLYGTVGFCLATLATITIFYRRIKFQKYVHNRVDTPIDNTEIGD